MKWDTPILQNAHRLWYQRCGWSGGEDHPVKHVNKAGESSPPDHLPFRRSLHNATVEEGGSKVHLFNGFIKVAKHAIVALWPMNVDFAPTDGAATMKYLN